MQKSKYAVISGEYEYSQELEKYDIIPIKTAKNPHLQTPVAYHADMNCATVGSKVYVAAEQTELIGELCKLGFDVATVTTLSKFYPSDVALNLAICGNTAILNPDSIYPELLEDVKKSCQKKYYVNQGYAGCSTLFINENAVITADNGIYNSIKDEIDTLKISGNDIPLFGYDKGFIGGCAKLIGNTLVFFGDEQKLTEYAEIKAFCRKYYINTAHLSGSLCDIGGMIILPQIS